MAKAKGCENKIGEIHEYAKLAANNSNVLLKMVETQKHTGEVLSQALIGIQEELKGANESRKAQTETFAKALEVLGESKINLKQITILIIIIFVTALILVKAVDSKDILNKFGNFKTIE